MPQTSAPRRTRTGDARDRAAFVLTRVEADGAFAAAALDATLDLAPPLGTADRGLCTQLVYGVLRTMNAIDARLAHHATRAGSLAKLDPYARAVLRVAAYQVLALARVPPSAAVNAAVGALRRDRSPGLAGFANALLRALAKQRPDPLDDEARLALAMESIDPAVTDALSRGLGSRDEALSVLRAMLGRAPETHLRTNTVRIATRDALIERLRTELAPTARMEPGALAPLALRVAAAGDLAATRAWREGLFAVQEEGAQAVALACGVGEGARVLDACAGRGGKTTALAAAMNARGVLHAVDAYGEKLTRIEPELERLGLPSATLSFATAAVDLTRGEGALARLAPPDGYDVVLVDAPCSGLGTLGRRPDLALRGARAEARSDDDASVPAPDARRPLPEVQRAILDRVASRVKRGGMLVYAVCTLTHDEGRDVIDAFRSTHPDFAPTALDDARIPARLRGESAVLRPDTDGCDGFMLWRLRRTAGG